MSAENKQLKDYIATTELEIVADANAHRDEIKQLKEELELANQRKMPYGWTTESCKNWMDHNKELKEEIEKLTEECKENFDESQKWMGLMYGFREKLGTFEEKNKKLQEKNRQLQEKNKKLTDENKELQKELEMMKRWMDRPLKENEKLKEEIKKLKEENDEEEDPSIITCEKCGDKASLDGKHVTGVGVGHDASICENCEE